MTDSEHSPPRLGIERLQTLRGVSRWDEGKPLFVPPWQVRAYRRAAADDRRLQHLYNDYYALGEKQVSDDVSALGQLFLGVSNRVMLEAAQNKQSELTEDQLAAIDEARRPFLGPNAIILGIVGGSAHAGHMDDMAIYAATAETRYPRYQQEFQVACMAFADVEAIHQRAPSVQDVLPDFVAHMSDLPAFVLSRITSHRHPRVIYEGDMPSDGPFTSAKGIAPSLDASGKKDRDTFTPGR